MIGASTAVASAAVRLTGGSVTELDCGADCVDAGGTCFVLRSDALSVTGSAGLTATGSGDIPTIVRVDGDILLATDDTVTVKACGDGSAVYAPETNTVTLNSAKITRGVAYWYGGEAATGVYARQPVNLCWTPTTSADNVTDHTQKRRARCKTAR